MDSGVDHLAVPFAGAHDLAARLEPALGTALTAGDPVLAVLADPERDAVSALLGPDASRVDFADPVRVHAVPAFTVAVRWARLARQAVAGRVLVIGQHLQLPDVGVEHWARLDLAIDVAIEGLPITVLCACPDSDPVIGVTHPQLLTADGPRPGPGYRPPPEALVEYPPPPPPHLGPADTDVAFRMADLSAVRRRVAAAAASAGLDDDRADDLVLAVNELATNSVEHGPGAARLQLWATAGSVIAEVADRGRMNVPFPGLVRPSSSGARGRGLWLASELTDVLQVWSDDEGTVVRVRME
ncbi:ATP-binding protein [Pseudonocardia abyssalis]|jgi:anti-sigma regulatory factor (Ser/Thr protein kinase)|uniref:ATP-binding protein n=1 Tax=Pseudonocardia abyssalis TaxID=2792008 RepID=A0ABS6UYM2_9PSEU|nr:ATP-binding protein [Pseudonocardia abyssalis]MBW0117338.1 ATP-binding protein [Pseudonocardia abyssalis]MBW0137334.1 ATP-binding protein [Pseudonocardia abyssalis]